MTSRIFFSNGMWGILIAADGGSLVQSEMSEYEEWAKGFGWGGIERTTVVGVDGEEVGLLFEHEMSALHKMSLNVRATALVGREVKGNALFVSAKNCSLFDDLKT